MFAHPAYPDYAILVVRLAVPGESGKDRLTAVEGEARLEGDGTKGKLVNPGHAGAGIGEQVDEQQALVWD